MSPARQDTLEIPPEQRLVLRSDWNILLDRRIHPLQETNDDIRFKRTYPQTPSTVAQATFFYLLGVGHMVCNRDFWTRRSECKGYLLFYTVSGSGYLIHANKRYLVPAGSLFLVDMEEYHAYGSVDCDAWEVKFVHFAGGMSQEYCRLNSQRKGPLVNLAPENPISSLVDRLLEHIEANLPQRELEASSLILQILTEAMKHSGPSSASAVEDFRSHQVQAALDFIAQHSHEKLTLAEVAQAMNASVFHGARLFKRITGFSPHEYLTKLRLNNAKQQLLYSADSVEQIAFSVGFASSNTFIKAFQKIEGLSPLQFRRTGRV